MGETEYVPVCVCVCACASFDFGFLCVCEREWLCVHTHVCVCCNFTLSSHTLPRFERGARKRTRERESVCLCEGKRENVNACVRKNLNAQFQSVLGGINET